MSENQSIQRKPSWLKKKIACGAVFQSVKKVLKTCRLNTVCEEALCPNRGECFSKGTATFLILGKLCTRDCRFCAVQHGVPLSPDPEEPYNVAEAVEKLGLKYVVITSVTRDDLPDGGAGHFVETIMQIRQRSPHIDIEVLIPDFQGKEDALRSVVGAHPDVINHNIETVPRLYPYARSGASYQKSLDIMRKIGKMDKNIPVKSGLMLGMGETEDEINNVLLHLREAGCTLLTLGQYLTPRGGLIHQSPAYLPVSRYVTPQEFNEWQRTAVEMGFKGVVSGPFVRSSYNARELYESLG